MTESSKEARELLTAVYSTGQSWTFFDRREEQVRLIQRALDEARADALEEAAMVLDDLKEVYMSPEYAFPSGCLPSSILAGNHANEIRKLKNKGDGND